MLLEGYRQNVAYRLRDLAEALRTTSEDLAGAAGIELEAMEGIPSGDIQRLRQLVEILDIVEQRFPSLPAAYAWYRSAPLPGYSGQTAMQLVLAGRIREVRDCVDAVDTGVHA